MAITQVASYTPLDRQPRVFSVSSPAALLVDNQTTFTLVIALGRFLTDLVQPGERKLYKNLSNIALAPGFIFVSPTDYPDSALNLAGSLTITSYDGGDTLPATGSYTPGSFIAPPQQRLHDANDLTQTLQVIQASAYGAVNDGVTINTAAVQAAVNAAGAIGGATVDLGPGVCLIDAPIALTSPNVHVRGHGRGATTVRGDLTFSGTAFFTFTSADTCSIFGVRLDFANTTTATNPAANGIEVTTSRYFQFGDLEAYYLNGYVLESVGNASASALGLMGSRVHALHCSGGVHTIADTAQTFGVQHWFSDFNLEIIDTLDAWLLEDSADVILVGMNGAVQQGAATNSFFHIKGAANTILASAVDVGVFPLANSSAPVCLIESGANGSPKFVSFDNGVLQGGTAAAQVAAGSQLRLSQMKLSRAFTYGFRATGSADGVILDGCTFDVNGQSGAAGRYDVSCETTGRVTVKNTAFVTAQGTTTGKTNNAVNLASGTLRIENSDLVDASYSATNAVNQTGGTLTIVNWRGYTPLNSLSPQPAIPASGVDFPLQPTACAVYIHGGTTSNIKVGGGSTGMTTPCTVIVPAQTALNITYSVAPTAVEWHGL